VSDTVATDKSGAPDHSLKAGVLGLFDSVIMGIAGSAPGYSIAGTATVLFVTVYYGGAAALLYCGIFMFGIVFAFSYLSRDDSHAGAAYSWVRRAIHPILGYLSGWALVVSALVFMVIATFPAGGSVINIFTNATPSKLVTTIIGAVFFMCMVAAVAAGVTVTVKVQIIMSSIEVLLLVLFAGLALFHAPHVHAFTWSWFSPSVFHAKGSGTFAAGALVAAFFYWGWDVTANLNEETKKPPTTSGLGGVIGVIIVFLLFEVFTVATNMVLKASVLENPKNSTDILAVLGQAVWRGWGGKLLILSVVLSTVATLETTLIQVTRTLFTMGRDNTLPKALGMIHPTRKTPVIATATAAVFSLLLFVASSSLGSIYNILNDGVTAIGLQICIYYGLAGFSVVILYRRQLFKSVGNLIFMGIWPFVGAVFMMYVLVNQINSLSSSNVTALYIGLGAMALGFIPLIWYWAKGNPYFKMPDKIDRHAQLIELAEMQQNL
jgi:amino acid transporter